MNDENALKGLEAYANLFHNTPAGRLIMADLKASLDRPTYRPGMNRDDTIWLEGRRSVYLDIVAAIGAGIEAIEAASSQSQPVLATVLTEPLD